LVPLDIVINKREDLFEIMIIIIIRVSCSG